MQCEYVTSLIVYSAGDKTYDSISKQLSLIRQHQHASIQIKYTYFNIVNLNSDSFPQIAKGLNFVFSPTLYLINKGNIIEKQNG